jgi:tetratricopeptide (TPR) repeat protein
MDLPAIVDLFTQGNEHERANDLVPARRLLTEALEEGSAAGVSWIVQASHHLLGVVEHKAARLDEARPHLEEGLRLAIADGDLQSEAFSRQEVGFLKLDEGDFSGALIDFRRELAIAPGTGILNLSGNGLSGMGVALLGLDRPGEAIPLLNAALSIRTEIGDLEQQHIDLTHLAVAALRCGDPELAAAIAGFLAATPETAAGMYGHDKRALDSVLQAVQGQDVAPAESFEKVRILVHQLQPAEES